MQLVRRGPMREHDFSPIGRAAVWFLVACMFLRAAVHLLHGRIPHPYGMAVIAAGFLLFLVAKLSVVSRGHWISFGCTLMSNGMANTYRLGYWLMAVGFLLAFL